MTTITDELAAARGMQDALIRAKIVLQTVARDRIKHGTISTAALQACHQINDALAKYEAAKAQVTSDLVKRLRSSAEFLSDCGDRSGTWHLQTEAADRIEALEAVYKARI